MLTSARKSNTDASAVQHVPTPADEHPPCFHADPDLFYPDKGESPRGAKRICAGCDQRRLCLDIALREHERFGVWGGVAERDRRRMLICDRDDDEFRRILSINELELQRLLHPGRPADMSGLWFGVCSEGHEVVDGNAYLWGWASSGRPRVTCRRCARTRDAAQEAAA